MARVLDEDELIGTWTLVGDELEQLSGRRGATKLGFALLLRFYAVHGRFPAGRGEIPDQAVADVARLVDVPAAELGCPSPLPGLLGLTPNLRPDSPRDPGLEQAERERSWALASARRGRVHPHLAAAVRLSSSRVHQIVAAADLDALDAQLGELRAAGWPVVFGDFLHERVEPGRRCSS